MARLKKTEEMIRKVTELREDKKMIFKDIASELGIKEGYAWGLYQKRIKDSDKVPKEIIDAVTPWAEGMEQVTVVVYNPEDKGNKLNQLTIKIKIKLGLTGELRDIAISSAIQQNDLLKWVEL